MTTCWISFGPDLEPLVSESRRQAGTPEPRRDGLRVAGTGDEVARALADAQLAGPGWCRLEAVDEDESRRTVHVHAAHVRYITEL